MEVYKRERSSNENLKNFQSRAYVWLFLYQQMGFDELVMMVPSLAQQRNVKVSKATVLQKSKQFFFSIVYETTYPYPLKVNN